MARSSGVDQVLANLDAYVRQETERSIVAMEQVMAALEGWAKSEHSYTDRTANTTNSIRGFVSAVTDRTVSGTLSAGMSYDIFLELAREGKWAFLMPVIERHKADILKILTAVLGGQTPEITIGGATASLSFDEARAATAEERRRNPEAARAKDMAYRTAQKAASIERGRNRK